MMDRIQAYQGALAGLREELTEAEGRVQRIRAAITSIQELIADPARPSPQQTLSTNGGPKPSNGKPTMVEAAHEVLRNAGRPLHTQELVRLVNAMGAGNPDPRKLRLSLVGTLDRMCRSQNTFTKPAAATYGLLEAGRP